MCTAFMMSILSKAIDVYPNDEISDEIITWNILYVNTTQHVWQNRYHLHRSQLCCYYLELNAYGILSNPWLITRPYKQSA